MTPEFAAANDRTRTPNKSSCRLPPANAPLSAKTKVPVRSSTSGSFSMIPLSGIRLRMLRSPRGRSSSSCRQPGAARDDQRFHTGLQGGMENGCEFRAVVHRKLGELICRFRLCIGFRIRGAHEPEILWYVPFGPEGSEVLTRRGWPYFPDALGAKMSSERVNYTLAGLPVVHVERIVIQRRDLRFARSAGCRRLGIDDPLDRGKHARPDTSVESPHIQLDDSLIRNDIFFRSRLQHADGYDCCLRGGDLTRNDGLQPHHRGGGHHHWIDARLRH